MQTGIEELFKQTQVGSYPTFSVKKEILDNFKSSKEYRHAFVEEKVRTQLAIQTKTIREQREMSRPTLAKLMEKANSWVFRLEDPNQSPPTIPTLLKVAEAFDVDLEIGFRPFSHLLNRLEHMTADSFSVPSIDDEVRENTFESRSNEEMSALWSRLQSRESGMCHSVESPATTAAVSGAKMLEMPNAKFPPQGIRTRVTRSERRRRPRMLQAVNQ